jgi:hypothetical protein
MDRQLMLGYWRVSQGYFLSLARLIPGHKVVSLFALPRREWVIIFCPTHTRAPIYNFQSCHAMREQSISNNGRLMHICLLSSKVDMQGSQRLLALIPSKGNNLYLLRSARSA